jgi:low temperature requirement protein LtrA
MAGEEPAFGQALAAAHRTSDSLLRDATHGERARVSYLELFFDLVYVFAITQLSHFLLEHHGWAGLAQGAVMFFAVWWAWMYTTWASNWADPNRLMVRIMLLLVMLASLVMAITMSRAFGVGAAVFAGCYVTIQVGRTLFMAWAMRETERGRRNMLRIAAWFAISGLGWLMGALEDEPLYRMIWWAAAIAFEYAGPFAGFRLPFLGRSTPEDWNISGAHMAERSALFIIIALGEGIIVTGATVASRPFDTTGAIAFLLAFAGSALMWWVYFDVGAERGSHRIETHAEPGRVARNAYTYQHIPIVGGIVMGAVADELLLAHPDRVASEALIAFQCLGMIAFLVGVGLFKRPASALSNFPLSHTIGLGLFAALGLAAWLVGLSAIVLVALSNAILLSVATWEWVSYHGGWTERLNRLVPGRRRST